MQYQQLGSATLHLSRIGFGCMSLGDDEKENEKLLHGAVAAGINFFDTADLYGNGANEVMVGKALQQKRQQVILGTKVGNQWRADGSGWDWNPRKDYIIAAVEKSLQRLRTDYIDLYQLHGGTIQDPIDETIEAFEQLVQAGKIRYYGISSIRPNVIREWVQRSRMVSVMMQYSLLDRRPEESCLPLLQEKHIGVIARGSLAQGLLVDKPPKAYLQYTTDNVQRAATAVQNLAGADVQKRAATALQFALHNPAITTTVVGIRTEAHLNAALQAITAPPLNDSEIQQLQSAIPPNQYTEHR